MWPTHVIKGDLYVKGPIVGDVNCARNHSMPVWLSRWAHSLARQTQEAIVTPAMVPVAQRIPSQQKSWRSSHTLNDVASTSLLRKQKMRTSSCLTFC